MAPDAQTAANEDAGVCGFPLAGTGCNLARMDDDRREALDDVLRMASVPIGTEVTRPDGVKVKTGPNLYVLGSLERRVTIYAQQIRALNLVAALSERVSELAGKRVCVIGGGIAGLTFAAGAAALGAHVTVLEAEAEMMSNIANCGHRWLHPRVYDWPRAGWSTHTAGLPRLDWEAAQAKTVATQVRQLWRAEVEASKEYGRPIKEHPATTAWIEGVKDGGHAVGTRPAKGLPTFDHVVIAVGFGPEKAVTGLANAPRYWHDVGFKVADKHILVAGCGDGGLIDVLRARIANYEQANLLEILRFPGRAELERRVEELEHDLIHNRLSLDELNREYNRLPNLADLDQSLELRSDGTPRLRPDTDVTLCGTGATMLERNASPLHRVLVHRLVERSLGVEYIPSPLVSVAAPHPSASNTTHLSVLKNGRQITSDAVVVRFGPESSLESSFPGLDQAMRAVHGTGRSPFLPRRLWDAQTFAGGTTSTRTGRPEDGSVHLEDWSASLKAQIVRAMNVAKEVDIHVCHSFDDLVRPDDLARFRRSAGRLRLIVSEIGDLTLRSMLLQKYAARDPSFTQATMEQHLGRGLRTLLGDSTTVEFVPHLKVTVNHASSEPFAREIYATKQRITLSYYRADDRCWLLPLRANEARDPAPRCIQVLRAELPTTFDYYRDHFETVLRESHRVLPP